MYRKYRRPRIDFEILIAAQEIMEIAEDMALLEPEILKEILAVTEMDYIAGLIRHLKAKNPKLDNVAIMSGNGQTKIVLLFTDKTGIVVGRRRNVENMIRNVIRSAA